MKVEEYPICKLIEVEEYEKRTEWTGYGSFYRIKYVPVRRFVREDEYKAEQELKKIICAFAWETLGND